MALVLRALNLVPAQIETKPVSQNVICRRAQPATTPPVHTNILTIVITANKKRAIGAFFIILMLMTFFEYGGRDVRNRRMGFPEMFAQQQMPFRYQYHPRPMPVR